MPTLAPIKPPRIFPAAIVNPSAQMIWELKPKTKIAPRFVARLTSFAVTDASRNAKPRAATSASIRNDPVPGPKIPS